MTNYPNPQVRAMSDQTETKTITRYLNVYEDGSLGAMHPTREQADRHATGSRIACVELTGTYEVPVETVLVELTREDAEQWSKGEGARSRMISQVVAACREALEGE